MTISEQISAEDLQRQGHLLNKEVVERDHRISFLEEQLAWFKRQIFGKCSERVVSSLNNEQLFEGFENLPVSEEKQKKKIPPMKEANLIAMIVGLRRY